MNREEILRRQQELLTAARNEGRNLTEEEQREFDDLQRTLESMRDDHGQRGGENGESVPAQVTDSDAQAAERAIAQERQRVAQINQLCRNFNIPADDYIARGSSMEEVRAAVLEQLQRDRGPVNTRVTADEGDKFRSAAADGLVLRSGISVGQAAAGAEEFRGTSLRDLAIQCMAREGEDTMTLLRMSPEELYGYMGRQFYNPTAAFPAILDNAINKSIVEMYSKVPTTFQAWTSKGSLSDFKETRDHEYIMGGLGDFEEVPENGEIKADIPQTELLPTRKLKTYGKQFSMTRQAFVNDDIGFLTRVPGLYATKAKKTIDKQVYSLIFKNEKIWDGKPLFDAAHENVVTAGGKPSQQSIQAMILQMQKQKDPFGDPILMVPKWIIVPVGYEFDLAVVLHSSQVTGSNNNDYNPLYNYPITIVQTPMLNAMAAGKAVPWFMVADPMSAKSVHVDYLNGKEMPFIRRMEAPGTLGFTWDIFMDWGICVRDFRGIAKNPGEVVK